MVRVRLAPSPTGSPHIGTAWQALFNYVFARKSNGKFILRLEDTDRERYVPESVNQIYETLNWLGLQYDEGPDAGGEFGPYIQSERLDIYKKYIDELLEKNLAYKEEGAIRFRTHKAGKTSWRDLVGDKDISFGNDTQEDFVILKSDGYPTYNFANVVDDHLMEITHVVRGNEFISSTPKHLMIYQAFNWKPPHFAHLPVLVGSDRSKLSKRHGAKSALEFKQDGYLKEGVLNFLALLGWSHPQGKEVFDIEEMIKLFDFKDINLSSAFFDVQKLDWLNGEYIRKMPDEELTRRLHEYLVDHPARDKLAGAVPLVKERIKKLSDFIPLTDFLWAVPEYDVETFKRLKIKDLRLMMEKVLKELEKMEKPWKADIFEKSFRDLAEKEGLSATQMFQLIRVGISGQTVTPPLFESIKILGEEEVVARIKKALSIL
ncbi:MAG: glutamyl-tRNA synthetase [Microgenomates group bacterium Gr01-1014_80]|nr:MAG: glutamyl-tRNA synthetase [Microgenomates group bacterium Gr01-1014_80]